MVSNASKNSVISYEAYLLFFERRQEQDLLEAALTNGVDEDNQEDINEVQEDDLENDKKPNDEEEGEEEGEEEWWFLSYDFSRNCFW